MSLFSRALLKSFYRRNKKLIFAILGWLTAPVLAVLMGLGFVSEYASKGEIVFKDYHIYGNNAKATAWLTLFGGVIYFIYAIFLISRDFRAKRTRRLYISALEKPKYVKCPHCQGVFFGRKVNNMTCPTCAGKLEDLHKYYESHQEEKCGVDDDGDSYRISITFSILSVVILVVILIVILHSVKFPGLD